LSKQANDIQPNVPTFQDTYAWALFQSGRFDEALIWIERAVGNDTKPSGELLEHYGDILYKTGKTKDAVEQWKKAATLGGASEKINAKISSQKID
jgi:predicted negative regulator of RcsB-dependent stress response